MAIVSLALALALSAPSVTLAGVSSSKTSTATAATSASTAATGGSSVAAISTNKAGSHEPTTRPTTTTVATTVDPTASTTLKVFTKPRSTRKPVGVVAVHTTPKPKPVVLPPSVVEGVTGGCVNATGSRSRWSKNHTAVLNAALIMYMKMNLRFDAFSRPYHPLVAGSVRLGFHACASGRCGGCINVNNPANNGLNFTIEALDDFLHQLKAFSPFADCDITYADLWQAAASAALQISLFDKSTAKYYVPVVFGRRDCVTAPYTDDIIPYPDRRDTIDKVLAFFDSKFNLTAQQVVAVMASHSLGVIRDVGTPNILGQWDNSPDASKIDFYSIIMNQAKVWLPTPVKYTNEPYPIYSYSKKRGFLFLTPDFSLVRNITIKNETTGEPACRLDLCPFSSTYKHVAFFSKNVTSWAQTFSAAYTRITTAGYASGELQAP